MKRLKSILLLTILAVLTSSIAEAQGRFTKRKQYWSIGGSINAMNYMGDITPNLNPASIDFKFTRENFGLEAVRRMSPRMSVRGQFLTGRITGNDNDHPRNGHDNRDQAFKNRLTELSVMGIFDLYENRGTFLKRPDYTPYATFGLAAVYHNPKILTNNGGYTAFNNIDLNPTSALQGSLMYGVGFRYKLARQLDIALEMVWRLTTTDKLDGVYGDYHDPADYGVNRNTTAYNDISADNAYLTHNKTGSYKYAGDVKGKSGFTKQDAYLVTGFHLTYILTGHVVCPKFR